jgi:hypothetical protein
MMNMQIIRTQITQFGRIKKIIQIKSQFRQLVLTLLIKSYETGI